MKKSCKVYSIKIWSVLFLFFSSLSILLITHKAAASTGDIYTVSGAGVGTYSGDGGQAAAAGLKTPAGISVDASGNIYIADKGNQRIRKVDANGNISTFAGTGTAGYSGDGGLATQAGISSPAGICLNPSGEVVFADRNNSVIRKVNAAGVISTVAGNGRASFGGDGRLAVKASLKYPEGVAADSLGNLYIADTGNNRIRKVDASGKITTFAGNGTGGYSGDGGQAIQASINNPKSVAVDRSGNIYIADSSNNRIRRVDASGIITTVAGDGVARYAGDGGTAASASLNGPVGVALDLAGNILIADLGNNALRKVDLSGAITTVAGTAVPGFSGDGGQATAALLNNPCYLAVDSYGDVFVTDNINNRARMIESAAYPVPISAITDPQSCSQVLVGGLTVSGKASAMNGVSFVEVSTDNGATWFTTSGTDQWTYSWLPKTAGNYYILSRANDSINGKERLYACSLTTAILDGTPPVSKISSPAQGASLTGVGYTLTGTATDGTGSGVSKVEVSMDGGASWSTASGTTSWSYTWSLPSSGTFTLMSRGTDCSGNLETPAAGVTVTVSQAVALQPVVVNSLTPTPASATAGDTVSFTAAASGGTGSYLYQFQRKGPDTGGANIVVQDYASVSKWSWATTTAMAGINTITVNVKNSDGSGSVSTMSASYTLATPAPTVPSSQAMLTWGASTSANLAGYKVYWGTSTGSYTQHVDAGNVTAYTFTSLATGTYYFTTTAYDSTGKESAYSNEVSKSVVDSTTPTSNITYPGQGAVLTGASYTIAGTATDGTGSGVAKVEVSVNGGVSWSTASGTTSWSYAWGLPSSGTYTIKSRATDNSGNVETPIASVTVTVSQPVAVSSLTPTPASATAGATVSFAAAASGGTGSYLYQYQRKGPDTGGVYTIAQDYGTNNKWAWLTTSAMAGSNTITVNVKNADGTGSVATMSVPYTLATPAPTVPSNQATLSWAKSTSTGVTGCKVYWGTSTGSYTQHVDAGNVTTYTFTSLSPGTYYFVTTAYDSTGKESAYSNEVTKTIPPQATLAWTGSTSAGVSGYKVYYGTSTGVYTGSVNVGNIAAYAINGLTSGTTYYFATTAYDSTGKESGYSNQVSKAIP